MSSELVVSSRRYLHYIIQAINEDTVTIFIDSVIIDVRTILKLPAKNRLRNHKLD